MTRRGPVTLQDPLPLRLGAWFAERFPPLNHLLLIASYSSSNSFLAQALFRPGEPVGYTRGTLFGAAATLCFFFHLRVFDEHKDHEDDLRYHPQRVLSRGLVSLRHLKVLGGLAIALELALAAAAGPSALAGQLAAFGFSLLMLREFFVRDWLRGHFLIYAGSHLLVMPLLALMLWSFATGTWPWEAPPDFLLYAWVGFFVTLNWEISRKIRAPGDEIPGVDTYSSIFGPKRAAALVLAVRVADTALVALVCLRLGLSGWVLAALVGLFLVTIKAYADFTRGMSARTAKRLEVVGGMYIVAFDMILALGIVSRYGIAR